MGGGEQSELWQVSSWSDMMKTIGLVKTARTDGIIGQSGRPEQSEQSRQRLPHPGLHTGDTLSIDERSVANTMRTGLLSVNQYQ